MVDCIIRADLVKVVERKTKNGESFKVVTLGKDYDSVDILSFDGVFVPEPQCQEVEVVCELSPRGYNYSLNLLSIKEL